MATQLQATITSINGATQASPISMSFPIDSVLVYEEGSGSVIQLGNNKFSSSDSLSSLSTTGLVQATVLTVDNGGAVNRQFLFPASKIGITSSSTGAAILYNSSFYYVSETEDTLVAAANAGGGGGGAATSLTLTDSNNVQWEVTVNISGALTTTQL